VTPSFRRHLPFVIVMVVAAVLRLYGLSWLPSPSGDEGNWTLYGLRILQHQPVALAPEASFVSLLYARLIALSMAVLGPTFLAARLVGALAVLTAIAVSYFVFGWLGSWRAGLTAAAALAVHPWAVFYARVASVPYGLAFAILTVGPLLFAAGLLAHRGLVAAAALVLTSVAIHFSPLALVGAAACGLFSVLPPHRWIWRRGAMWGAVAISAAHTIPVVLGAARVAQAAPDLPQLESFPVHLGGYVHMMGTGLMGEATVRHFTNAAMEPQLATVLIVPLVVLVGLAATGPERPVLGRFAEIYFALGVVLAPLILAPGRNWFLPANHMDRYLFALLPGFVLLVAEAAARDRALRTAMVALTVAWLALASGRAAWCFLAGSGVDHGEWIFDGGGGYRGWLVSDAPRPTMVRIRDVVRREAGGGPATILVADRAFIPLVFTMEGTGIPVYDVRRTEVPPRPAGPYFVILWPDEVLSVGDPPTAPPKYVASNRKLRERMGRLFHTVRLVERLRQRDGRPLLEIWRAEDPRPRLRLEPPEEHAPDEEPAG